MIAFAIIILIPLAIAAIAYLGWSDSLSTLVKEKFKRGYGIWVLLVLLIYGLVYLYDTAITYIEISGSNLTFNNFSRTGLPLTILGAIVISLILYVKFSRGDWELDSKQKSGVLYILAGLSLAGGTYYREDIFGKPTEVVFPGSQSTPYVQPPPMKVISTPFPTPIPPTPLPTLFPEPPRPTNFISYGKITINKFRVFTRNPDNNEEHIFATQFPSTTKELFWEMYFDVDSEPYVFQVPILVLWKLNGEEWNRYQFNLKFASHERRHSFGINDRKFPVGKYDIDAYWGDVWVTHTEFEVY